MTKDQQSSPTGDTSMRPRTESAARLAGAAASIKIPASPALPQKKETVASSLCSALQNSTSSAAPIGSCIQSIWISFFFDGTGNNLEADFNNKKHSNVAKLYRVHKGDENVGLVDWQPKRNAHGVYKIYIPGLGTYFPAIGDDGMGYSNTAGGGVGWYGDERLEWALNQFRQIMAHVRAQAGNPGNLVKEVNIAAFGFSRGAAAARAFIHDFVKNQCKAINQDEGKWVLAKDNYPVRIRFMGLFDTVASVGDPMASNNMKYISSTQTCVIHRRNRAYFHPASMPASIAFADKSVGADPAPGTANGHVGWGDRMMIPDMVEEVRHLVAAHEHRNSFPLDSIHVLERKGWRKRKNQFHEHVYPGVHSDVGGSYKPGEGGKNEVASTKLGLIPLHNMLKYAVDAEVPFHPKSVWNKTNTDFAMQDKVLDDFNYYIKSIVAPRNVGDLFNAHMGMYYKWRFHLIRRKLENKDVAENNRILTNKNEFEKERVELAKKFASEKAALEAAERNLKDATVAKHSALSGFYIRSEKHTVMMAALEKNIATCKQNVRIAHDNWSKVHAKMESLTKMHDLPSNADFYDNQLLEDAKAILSKLTAARVGKQYDALLAALRPHYREMMKAYCDEFINKNGLRDERIISFFREYVHDSMAGFAKDASFRSDPRVIYVGDDTKLPYAQNNSVEFDSWSGSVA